MRFTETVSLAYRSTWVLRASAPAADVDGNRALGFQPSNKFTPEKVIVFFVIARGL